MMALINDIAAQKQINRAELKTFLIILNPFAPHITEEIWQQQGFGGMITGQKWPTYDEDKCREDTIEIVLQVNGKIRARIQVAAAATNDEILALAKQNDEVAAQLEGKTIVKEICVPGKLCNFVVR